MPPRHHQIELFCQPCSNYRFRFRTGSLALVVGTEESSNIHAHEPGGGSDINTSQARAGFRSSYHCDAFSISNDNTGRFRHSSLSRRNLPDRKLPISDTILPSGVTQLLPPVGGRSRPGRASLITSLSFTFSDYRRATIGLVLVAPRIGFARREFYAAFCDRFRP